VSLQVRAVLAGDDPCRAWINRRCAKPCTFGVPDDLTHSG